MARIAVLSYIKRQSLVHELTGTTKLIFFIAWSVASMVTYDTRVLLCLFLISIAVFKASKIKIRDISIVLGLAAVFLLMNNFFVYVFSPEYGVELYGSRTVLFTIVGPYSITLQQLFYHYDHESNLRGSGGPFVHRLYESKRVCGVFGRNRRKLSDWLFCQSCAALYTGCAERVP